MKNTTFLDIKKSTKHKYMDVDFADTDLEIFILVTYMQKNIRKLSKNYKQI